MREILFRGKRVDDGNWTYGQYVAATKPVDLGQMFPFFVDKHYMCLYVKDLNYAEEVHEETIGQYTGMKDKNGVKIFEGDIVRRHEEPFGLTDVGVVVYNEAIGSFRLHVEKNGTTTRYDFVASDIYNDGYCHVECKATFEVIGNKFDNPELLEGGKQ